MTAPTPGYALVVFARERGALRLYTYPSHALVHIEQLGPILWRLTFAEWVGTVVTRTYLKPPVVYLQYYRQGG